MNKRYGEGTRKRGKTLLIVEGKHEKEELFYMIFKCFPEIKIDMDHVWIYGTNLYMLYKDIEAAYGKDWDSEDVDLPFVISKKKKYKNLRYKIDYTNIFLVFDFERQAPEYSEQKIMTLQKYFTDSTDMGRLYINYPMIEAYKHFNSIPDDTYMDRKVSATLKNGENYKALVKGTIVSRNMNVASKMKGILRERFGVCDESMCEVCIEQVLNISDSRCLFEDICREIENYTDFDEKKTAAYQFLHLISQMTYLSEQKSYWQYMRQMFSQIILHNIRKAVVIQGEVQEISKMTDRECFDRVDLLEIAKVQADVSRDKETGMIWVLCTCVFLVADYNFDLLFRTLPNSLFAQKPAGNGD